jgi:hypothetical protein
MFVQSATGARRGRVVILCGPRLSSAPGALAALAKAVSVDAATI